MNEVNSIMRAALQKVVDLDMFPDDWHPDGPDLATITINHFASLIEVVAIAEEAIAEADREEATA